MARAQPLGGAIKIELDDLRRTGADEEEHANVGAALQEAGDDAVEFFVGIGQPGEIALLEDRGREPRLGKNHDAGSGLDEVRACARADNEEEGVLDLAVQPDDAGEAAEDLALSLLAQNRAGGAAGSGGNGRNGGRRIHRATSNPGSCAAAMVAPCRRAARSFQRNWPALMR